MNADAFVREFFNTAENLGYIVEICKRGEAKGKKQVDFGNKKLHELHIRRLYPALEEYGLNSVDDFFEKIVAGRPCAVKGFREISATILK